MKVRRVLFSKELFLILGMSFILSACGRQGPKSPVYSTPSEQEAPQIPKTAPTSPPNPSLESLSLPSPLERGAQKLSPTADLPLVSGRIDIRDLKSSGPAVEFFESAEYRFMCDETAATGANQVAMRSPSGLLFPREVGRGDSLRRDFEFVFIRCQ